MAQMAISHLRTHMYNYYVTIFPSKIRERGNEERGRKNQYNWSVVATKMAEVVIAILSIVWKH